MPQPVIPAMLLNAEVYGKILSFTPFPISLLIQKQELIHFAQQKTLSKQNSQLLDITVCH